MDILFVILYLGVLLFNGIFQGQKIRSLKEFSVSTRKYGLFVLFASLSASFIGGGFSVGNAAEVFKRGIGNIAALFGFSVGQILIGRFIVAKAEFPPGATSPGMIMRKSYGRPGQITTGICSTMLNIGLLGAQIAAIGAMFNVLLHVPFIAGVIIGFAVILVYSTAGGLKAIIVAEVIEFLLLAVGLPVLLIYSVYYAGGVKGVIEKVPEAYFDIFNESGPREHISLFLALTTGEALTPTFIQRLLVGRDRKTIASATVISGIISIPVFIITGFVGLCAYAVNSNLNPELAMPYMVMKALPVGIKGLVISSMLAVVMSSADGCLASASIGIVSDIIEPLSRRKPGQKASLKIVRISNLVIGVMAMLLAIFMKDVFGILVFSYSAWSPVILVSLVAALLGIRAGRKAFAASAAGGAAASIIWTYVAVQPLGIEGATVGFFISLILFLLFKRTEETVHANGQRKGFVTSS